MDLPRDGADILLVGKATIGESAPLAAEPRDQEEQIMVQQRAEECFRRGVDLIGGHHYRDALGFFRAALDLEQCAAGAQPREPRYLSYYGYCLAATRSDWHAAMQCCREAANRAPEYPEIWWNLGRVALASGRRSEAYRALQRGLELQPGHNGISRALRRMGVRRRPALPFLARTHPVNVLLGQLRRSA